MLQKSIEPGNRDELNENNAGDEGQQERFESDTQKIIHRHLQNEDDVISDDDIRNVRVGMTPPALDAPTEARFEDEEEKDKVEEEYIGDTGNDNDTDETHEEDRITPWDTVDNKE
jgi:hypothetical protein